MAEQNGFPPYGKLINKFAAIGPYLRDKKSSQEMFFFDCLAVCVNAKKSPEKREFWGWWLELKPTETGFEYSYQFGRFDEAGNWQNDKVPAKYVEEVSATASSFYEKLKSVIEEEFSLDVQPAPSLKEASLGSAA
ncbi:sigma factor-binding protein Crl [Parasalinivibrio latis]|uniref:sigma factor-binding protein Crl n=1 Tax=Parasalinivibrio latis TaxID=2952610 RepID=UPI0030DFDDEE